jgi:hypothetical protein
MRISLLDEKSKKEYISPLKWAVIYALLGEKGPAFVWLEKAVDARNPAISRIKIEPAHDSLRSDERSTTLLQRVNLTP